jgi:Uma2 family endonuclease
MAMPEMPVDLASRYWTPDDVRALNEESATTRYECVDGELLVTPGPSWDHQHVIGRLFRTIADYLDIHRIGYPFFAPADVRLTGDSLMQPDLFVAPLVDGMRPRGGQAVDRLLLAVEVLSPSSGRGDRVVKRRLHQRAGTPEYWIVDPDARVVERWRPDDARPEILADVLTWQPEDASASLILDIERLLLE